jgi:hypothetical protein
MVMSVSFHCLFATAIVEPSDFRFVIESSSLLFYFCGNKETEGVPLMSPEDSLSPYQSLQGTQRSTCFLPGISVK